MNFQKKTILAILLGLVAVPLLAQQLPSKAADADTLATEAEEKMDKAIEATETTKEATPANNTVTNTNNATSETTRTATNSNANDSSLSSALYNDGKMNFATSATKFELTAADSISSIDYIEYRIDDSPFMRYKEPFNIEQEGLRRITYRSVDKAGNREGENMFAVTIDNTPPVITTAINGSSFTKNGVTYVSTSTKLDLHAIDTYSGVKKVEYAINDKEFQEGSTVVFSEAGRQRVRYRASDNLNNVSPEQQVASLLLDVDTSAPAVTIKTSRRPVDFEGKKYALPETVYTVEALDDGAGIDKVLVRVDGEGDFQPYTAPIQFTNEGPHSIEAKAVDNVGNESEVVKLDVVTDDEPPRSTIKVIGKE